LPILAQYGLKFQASETANFPITGKKTGNFCSHSLNHAPIAGFRDTHAPEQGINREFTGIRVSGFKF
jgi:hypothetical protein